MKNCVYLAAPEKKDAALGFAQTGFGFAADGSFLAPEICAEVLVLDDRFLPSVQGLEDAAAFFREAPYETLLCDFEQPRSEVLAELLALLGPRLPIVPPQYAGSAHAAVFLPPCSPALPFLDWFKKQQKRYGSVVLDLQPVCCRILPGHTPEPVPLCAGRSGFRRVSEALFCTYRVTMRHGQAVFLLRDTMETYLHRAQAARCPCIVPAEEYYMIGDG